MLLEEGIIRKLARNRITLAGQASAIKQTRRRCRRYGHGADMNQMRHHAKGALRALGDFLWPPRSLVSGRRGIGAGPLSPEEFSEISFLSGALCRKCALPQPIDLGEDTICPACSARPPKWRCAGAAMIYDEGSRRIILDLKHSGRRDGLRTMAGWMMQAGGPLARGADLIIPVPLHYRRLASRGFNQAAWLGTKLSRLSATPMLVDGLKRRKAAPSQSGLNARQRRRNVSGAFHVPKRKAARIEGQKILLVDDVLTTGATLDACTQSLIRAKAAQIDVLVLARVVRPVDVTI